MHLQIKKGVTMQLGVRREVFDELNRLSNELSMTKAGLINFLIKFYLEHRRENVK